MLQVGSTSRRGITSCLTISFLSALPVSGDPVWTLQTSSGPPSRVNNAGMAYDSWRSVAVLFGGSDTAPGVHRLDDTWEWDGTVWNERVVATRPSARIEHAMVYDSCRRMVVLFGGSTPGLSNETWEWDGTAWTLRSTTGPAPRYTHEMAFDSNRCRTVLFGGVDAGLTPFGDTWEWDGVSWSQVSTTGPSARQHHAMTFDSCRNRVVLFGGSQQADTWEWNGTAWTDVTTIGPAARNSHQMVFDSRRCVAVVYGGRGANDLNDTWEWNGTAWSQGPVGPGPRQSHTMCYDSKCGLALLFGGGHDDVIVPPETWGYGSKSCIPAVSEWGLAAMSLLVLVIGTLAIKRAG